MLPEDYSPRVLVNLREYSASSHEFLASAGLLSGGSVAEDNCTGGEGASILASQC